MQDEINLLKEENDSIQSKLDQCESGNQDAIIMKNELDACREDLDVCREVVEHGNLNLKPICDFQNVKILENENKMLKQSLLSAKINIEALMDEKKVSQNQLLRTTTTTTTTSQEPTYE